MAGLVPAIHVFGVAPLQDVDARDKHGHGDAVVVGQGAHGVLQIGAPVVSTP